MDGVVIKTAEPFGQLLSNSLLISFKVYIDYIWVGLIPFLFQRRHIFIDSPNVSHHEQRGKYEMEVPEPFLVRLCVEPLFKISSNKCSTHESSAN